ncbi:glycosyl hydrolase family 79 C-terminal domain-containing protein [Aspergillus ruber CBS 135680]|uniref:Beta-glucuronidase C-terminal domain-containing protein n=1 Tax=Aspergillus ruber (strain CBS 135680) TaxID=1388766 RepID=A0A017SIA0_ASPRC|nr:uncharacterized protein EURHEDRAFT_553719 [Aspergillus ruber CBS 135680]EYE96476.1 hypothetical protein EURHEDRAFT_553719 [Aspergillus ruber CBS 135680]
MAMAMTSGSLLLGLLAQQAAGQLLVPHSPPAGASEPVPKGASSFSIEFSSVVDYFGNTTHPNEYSQNLLFNLKNATGAFPKIRIGGTTQDRAFYNPNQNAAINLTYETPTDDQPIKVTYGPDFFQSYHAIPGLEFSYGLNLAYNGSDQSTQLSSAAAAACKNMGSALSLSELGNEPDFYPGYPSYNRPPNWTMTEYIREWNWKTGVVTKAMEKECPGVNVRFVAPSFIWSNCELRPCKRRYGVDANGCSYMDTDCEERYGLTDLSMQSLLMNHTGVVGSLAVHLDAARDLSYLGLPYTLSEVNGMALQGGAWTWSMGSALWVVDFALWSTTNNIKRINFHQGTGYRYVAWQPVPVDGAEPNTRPPYYGQIMVAHALGNSNSTRLANIPLPSDTESAYAVYHNELLSRLVALNLEAWYANSTTTRPSKEYTFRIPGRYTTANVLRFMGPGADARSNLTFDGVSYDYELGGGKPVVVDEMGKKERVHVKDGMVRIEVPASSGAILVLR